MPNSQKGPPEVQRGQDPEPMIFSNPHDAVMNLCPGKDFLNPVAEMRGVGVAVVPEFADDGLDEVVGHLEVPDSVDVESLTRFGT